MNEQQPSEIFFHVGLGKTGTKYIQYRFFPQLKGITYIQRTSYRKYPEIIAKNPTDRYLVSNEFDRQLEREVKNIAGHFPQAKAIIVLRRQDSWIASQYRRFVKNGLTKSFSEFIDLDDDQGDWKQRDLLFYPKLQFLEKHLNGKPLVLFHDELKNDPHSFFDKIAAFTGTTYDKEDISLAPKHTSYNEKQLKVMRKVGGYLFAQNPRHFKSPFWRRLWNIGRMARRYPLLYSSLLVPNSWVDPAPLIPPEELKRIKEEYTDDWERCVQYAQ